MNSVFAYVDPQHVSVYQVKAGSTEPGEAASNALHAAVDILLAENAPDWERVTISIAAAPRGHAAAKAQRQEQRRLLRRTREILKLQRGQQEMLKNLGLQAQAGLPVGAVQFPA